MKKYVLVYLFTLDFKNVWLIEKQKPECQKGCLNGIGGKLEDNESYYECAVRELKEESGLYKEDLYVIGSMGGTNNDSSKFEVEIFTGKTSDLLENKEAEKINLYNIEDIKNYKHIQNLPMIIQACLYYLTGKSAFSRIEIKY